MRSIYKVVITFFAGYHSDFGSFFHTFVVDRLQDNVILSASVFPSKGKCSRDFKKLVHVMFLAGNCMAACLFLSGKSYGDLQCQAAKWEN